MCVPLPELEETERRILEFLCQRQPFEPLEASYESRSDVSGELRLSLSEYDEACGSLLRLRLISTDQPTARDCDFIRPTRLGRRAVSTPQQPGKMALHILKFLGALPEKSASASAVMLALNLPADHVGWRAYQSACEKLYAWDFITRQADDASHYATLGLTAAGLALLSPTA